MIVAGTGHRPDKLGGWKLPNAVYYVVRKRLMEELALLKPDYVISGMALGVDQWLAEACIDMGIPFVAAIPFEGQEGMWPDHARARYHHLLSKAHTAYIIEPGAYAPYKMHVRNQWMVDSCDVLLAVWNGSTGGTAACVGYAQKVGRKIHFCELPKEAWALAEQMNPKKLSTQNLNLEELPKPAAVSAFVSLVKEKAEKKAQEMLKVEEELAYKKVLLNKKMSVSLALKDLALEDVLKNAEPVKLPKSNFSEKLKEEKTRSSVPNFGRVLDLEDD